MSERDDDFLSRWSRRKADARGGLLRKEGEPEHKPGRMRTDAPRPKEDADAAGAPAGAVETGQETRQAALKQEEPEARAPEGPAQNAPGSAEPAGEPANYDDFDFDSLNYASDYTQFMKKGVPDAVRRRALRMLWQSNPVLANIDGLNDYDEDFTDAAMVIKAFASNWKVGSGYLSEEERLASYSDEAREAGEKPAEDEAAGADDAAGDDIGDGEDDGEDAVHTASAEGDTGNGENDKQEDSPERNRTG